MKTLLGLVGIIAVIASAGCSGADSSSATSVVAEDGAAIVGFGTAGPSLSTMPAPAIVARLSGAQVVSEDGVRIAIEAIVTEMLHVDESRQDVPPMPLGPVSLWVPSYAIVGPGGIDALGNEIESQSLVAVLGYHTDSKDLPSAFEIMALLVEAGEDVAFVGPHSSIFDNELAAVADVGRTSRIDALVALSKELSYRDVSVSMGTTPRPLPLLTALAPPASVDWSSLPNLDKDVLDAPPEVRAALVERTIVIEFEEGASAPGWVLGVLSDAGWTGATTLDVGVPFVVPALVDPDSDIKIVIMRDSPQLEDLTQIATLDASTWSETVGFRLLVTRALLDAVSSDSKPALNAVQVTLIMREADLRDIVRSLETAVGSGSTGTTDPETGRDESEILQNPNEPPADD